MDLKPYTATGYLPEDDAVFTWHVQARDSADVRRAALEAWLSEVNEGMSPEDCFSSPEDLGRMIITGIFEGHIPLVEWVRDDWEKGGR